MFAWLSVEDNGQGPISERVGDGTKQAQRLATSLRGRFERSQNLTKGVTCSIEWNLSR